VDGFTTEERNLKRAWHASKWHKLCWISSRRPHICWKLVKGELKNVRMLDWMHFRKIIAELILSDSPSR